MKVHIPRDDRGMAQDLKLRPWVQSARFPRELFFEALDRAAALWDGVAGELDAVPLAVPIAAVLEKSELFITEVDERLTALSSPPSFPHVCWVAALIIVEQWDKQREKSSDAG